MKANKVVNLTAHTLNEVTTGKSYPISGRVARVKPTTTKVAIVDGAPIYQTVFSELEGLPAPIKGTIYVVSALALNHVPADRTDVVAPGNLKRDENGQPIGCVGFRIN